MQVTRQGQSTIWNGGRVEYAGRGWWSRCDVVASASQMRIRDVVGGLRCRGNGENTGRPEVNESSGCPDTKTKI